jgi:hypothetical protein
VKQTMASPTSTASISRWRRLSPRRAGSCSTALLLAGRGGEELHGRAAGSLLFPLGRPWRRGRGAWRSPLFCSLGRCLSLADVYSSASPSPTAPWWHLVRLGGGVCLCWPESFLGASLRQLMGACSRRPGRTSSCRAPLPLLRPGRDSFSPAVPLQVACSPVVVWQLCSATSSES